MTVAASRAGLAVKRMAEPTLAFGAIITRCSAAPKLSHDVAPPRWSCGELVSTAAAEKRLGAWKHQKHGGDEADGLMQRRSEAGHHETVYGLVLRAPGDRRRAQSLITFAPVLYFFL